MTTAGRISILAGFILASLAMPGPAAAQSAEDFVTALAGDWAVYDDAYSAKGKTCQVTLKPDATEDGYGLTTADCTLEMADLTGWKIIDQQLALMIGKDQIAALGGNQIRMSGQTGIGAPLILDRIGANTLVTAITKAREASGCFYLGFSTTCAADAQLRKPAAASDGTGPKLGIVVNLNVRDEARDTANVIGVVPANSCIVAETCVNAVDGVWCRAQFGEVKGWLKKLALRQDKWPIVTFVNQCGG